MKDFFGNELAVGDKVAFITRQYRDLSLGTVDKINQVMIRVKYKDQHGGEETTQVHPSCLVKRVRDV